MATEHEKVHVICENLCLEEGMTKEQILNLIGMIESGSPKGAYETVAALKAANPDTGIYVVTANGHAYAWTKDSAGDPIDLGQYQSTGIADGSISYEKLDDDLQNAYDMVVNVQNTLTSGGADLAEIASWNDDNPNNEDRLYRFVTISDVTGQEVQIANSKSQIAGTTNLKRIVGFLGNYRKGDEDDKSKCVVSILGVALVKTYDKSITIDDRVMSDDNGYAVKSTNNLGYRVLDVVKEGLLKIVVSPNTDMIQRIKTDVGNLSDRTDNLESEVKTLNEGGLIIKDEVIEEKITEWLDNHPEATTTVEDNSLTDSKFTPETRLKKANYYNTVAAMKADNSLSSGMTAVTLGYYAANDGGAATYLVRTKTSEDVEDNGSIHFIGNNLVAELVVKGTLNVLNFGLKNDGIYDNTDLFTNVVKKALADKLDIYFPSGTYKGNFEIDLTKLYNGNPTLSQSKIHINVKGAGRNSILTSDSGSILALRGCATNESGVQTNERTIKWLSVSNLQINGLSRENDNIGIELNNCQNINLYDIEAFNCRQALAGLTAMDISISQCDFMDSGYIDKNNNVHYSLYFDKSSLSALTSNAIKISNCRIETTPAFIRARGGAYSIHVVNTKLELGRPNEVSSYRPIYIDKAKNVIFTNCHFQYSKGYTSADTPTRVNDYYFIRVNEYPDYSKNSGNRVLFNGCDFCTNPNYKALWFDGYNTNFNNCVFSGVDSSKSSRPFDLRGLCTLTNNTLFLNGGQSLFSIRGNNNIVKNLRLILDVELSSESGEIAYLSSGATNNYIECDRNIEKVANDVPFVTGASSFNVDGVFNYGSNVIKASDIKNLQSNNIVVSLRGNDFVVYDGTNFNKVSHIYEGQTVKFLFLNNASINVTGNIRTTTGLLKNFNANSLVEFLVHNGVLYEKE